MLPLKRWYRFSWTTHKWVGLALAPVFVGIAATGFLLLLKKDYDWIQPPTRKGAAFDAEHPTWMRLDEVFRIASGYEHFESIDAIDRVDFRPEKRIHKIRSKHDYWELQIDAVTGEVLSHERRMSDLIEQIHDGSFFAEGVHAYFMPLVAVALSFMAATGVYIWWFPIGTKRRRRRERAAAARAARTGSTDPKPSA